MQEDTLISFIDMLVQRLGSVEDNQQRLIKAVHDLTTMVQDIPSAKTSHWMRFLAKQGLSCQRCSLDIPALRGKLFTINISGKQVPVVVQDGTSNTYNRMKAVACDLIGTIERPFIVVDTPIFPSSETGPELLDWKNNMNDTPQAILGVMCWDAEVFDEEDEIEYSPVEVVSDDGTSVMRWWEVGKNWLYSAFATECKPKGWYHANSLTAAARCRATWITTASA